MTRPGFSLFEAVIAAAILALLGAAIVPSVVAYQDQKRIEATATDLLEIGNAVDRFELDVPAPAKPGTYPGKLSDLTTEIVLSNLTSCRTPTPRTYTQENATLVKWRAGGPFLDKVIPTTGLKLGVGIANDVLERSSTNTTVGYLNLRIPEVSYEDALMLNDVMDGPGDPETAGLLNLKGAIRWFVAPATSGTVSLIFAMPIGNTC